MTSFLFLVLTLTIQQHEHQVRPQTASADCADRVRKTLFVLDQAAQALELSRQSNDPAALRSTTDRAQLVVAEARQELQQCFAPSQTPAPAAPQEAIDPVCQMKVDPKTAPTATHHGQTYYFCSVGDRDIFMKDPAKYIKKE